MDVIVIVLVILVFVVVLGISSIDYKLKKKLENDERIIERLDLLINDKRKSNND
ncbi:MULTISPECIES: hypothetical protein [Paenibacillus]|uniref:Uncharacterized protein n=1 Tax=Paenibacillus radicis (ex Xue et al. 2023) TaxID=2972489 RepID=A0ABT1YKR9_9BACL|nr:hypothetical protein [Paenibacillus radicis (ex Xue et al. 2023)]MCR8633790.1 hypothetical protein [Paenibacillus radicis (ex Xue et al. 2023)]